MVFGVLVTVLTGQAFAIPNCNQINNSWCDLWETEGCYSYIEFKNTCDEELREWRCNQPSDPPDCEAKVSDWAWCWCEGDHPPCDCLLEGTPITLADGSTKPVEKIRKGDRVRAYDEFTAMMNSSEVVSVHAPYVVSHYFIINEKIRITEHHPVLSSGIWVSVGQLKVGDALAGADGSDARVFSIRRVDETATAHNFQVAGGTYVAHGIIVHNKEDCKDYEPTP